MVIIIVNGVRFECRTDENVQCHVTVSLRVEMSVLPKVSMGKRNIQATSEHGQLRE